METTRARSVAAFIIFGDTTLREIAMNKPTSLDQLRGVSGVGEKKLASYGAEIVGLISEML
jgi:ATP-dependent DNA helicase RecQ